MLLRINGSSFSGAAFLPGKGVTTLNATDRHRALLGTDLTVDDLMADFLDWPQQTITGEEMLETVPCAVVESRQASAKVKNWVDKKRYVTLKAEIYPTGGITPLRTVHSIEARRSDSGFYVPVKFSVSTTAAGTTGILESWIPSDFSPNWSPSPLCRVIPVLSAPRWTRSCPSSGPASVTLPSTAIRMVPTRGC